MKYKDYLKQTQPPIPYNPIRGNPIYCPDCGKLVAYDKDYMFMYLQHPVVCPDCDEIVIYPNIISYHNDTQNF